MPVDSNYLPKEAVDYLNNIETEQEEKAEERRRLDNEISKSTAKGELLGYCQNFISKSKAWRRNSYEPKWRKYQNNCDSIMDSAIVEAKEAWQSKAFVPITASHKETIQAHIFKVLAGVNPPLDVKARFDLGDLDQSLNIKDITVREIEKARWAIEFNKALEDALTFGSGFWRLYWSTETAKRKLRKEVREGFRDNIDGLDPRGIVGFALRAATGQRRVTGYEDVEEEVITYRGLKLRHYSIWDIYPDPKALEIKKSTIGCRFKFTYGDLVAGAKEGYYFADAAEKLKGAQATEKYPEGQRDVQADRDIADESLDRTDYGIVHDGYEIFGMFPQKWIYRLNDMPIDDPEKLVSARVMFHDLAVLAAEVNGEYDQEPPLQKLDYMPRNGEFYARGIPEMLECPQDVINEVVNQRLDNGAILLNKSFAILEKALINPKQDLRSKPGMMIRLDGKYIPNGDVRNAITELTMNDTPVRAGFSEVNEAERWAQERTSANRVTLGTSGLVKDMNSTLGGQEILKESAGDKFSFIGLLMELSFLDDFFYQVWKITYANITPQDVLNAIGPKRFETFVLVSPEELQNDYTYMPQGIFRMDNKLRDQMTLSQVRQQFIQAPWLDHEKFFNAQMQLAGYDPDNFKMSETDILSQQAGLIQPQGTPSLPPSPSGPATDLTGQPLPPEIPEVRP